MVPLKVRLAQGFDVYCTLTAVSPTMVRSECLLLSVQKSTILQSTSGRVTEEPLSALTLQHEGQENKEYLQEDKGITDCLRKYIFLSRTMARP